MDPTTPLEEDSDVRFFLNGAVSIESYSSVDVALPAEPSPSLKEDELPKDPPKRIVCNCGNNKICEVHGKNGAKVHSEKVEENFKRWLHKKSKEIRVARETQHLLEQIEITKKKINDEQCKKEFKCWLAKKKQMEAKEQKKQKIKEQRAATVKEQQEQARLKQSETSFKQWLETKKQEQTKRKLAEKLTQMKISDEKEMKKDKGKVAFDNWLKNSKDKPLPIRSGQGFDTLRSSATVTYINPIPWQPNIDLTPDK